MKTSLLPACLLALTLPLASIAADQAPPTVEELWEIIQKQQAEIEALKNQQQDTAKQAADADEKAEAAVVAVEESVSSDSGKASWTDRMKIGGYGELHYNNINNDGIDDKKEIDFHRFVLFFGYEFTEKLRFWSELELEHALAGDGKPGELELEQAREEHAEHDISEQMTQVGVQRERGHGSPQLPLADQPRRQDQGDGGSVSLAEGEGLGKAPGQNQLPDLHQLAGSGPNAAVVWDYHVILCVWDEGRWQVIDPDCRLGPALDAHAYIKASFNSALAAGLQPEFRLLPAREYRETLRTDRRHMRDARGGWLSPPLPGGTNCAVPSWPNGPGSGAPVAPS